MANKKTNAQARERERVREREREGEGECSQVKAHHTAFGYSEYCLRCTNYGIRKLDTGAIEVVSAGDVVAASGS